MPNAAQSKAAVQTKKLKRISRTHNKMMERDLNEIQSENKIVEAYVGLLYGQLFSL